METKELEWENNENKVYLLLRIISIFIEMARHLNEKFVNTQGDKLIGYKSKFQ